MAARVLPRGGVALALARRSHTAFRRLTLRGARRPPRGRPRALAASRAATPTTSSPPSTATGASHRDDDDDAMSVQEYLEKHDLSKKVEEALNAAVKAKAEEPLAFVVRASRARDGWMDGSRDDDGSGCACRDDARRAMRGGRDARCARATAWIGAYVFVSSNARARASGRRDVDARARWRR